MSIIHEALKKSGQPVVADAEKSRSSGTNKPDENKPSLQPPLVRHRKKASVNWGPLFVLALFFLVAAPELGPLLFKAARSTPNTDRPARSASMDQAVSAMHSQFAMEEAPIVPTPGARGDALGAPTSPFVLSGVVYAGQDSYCLINGKVLKRGERVGGATVERITPDYVTLDLGGQKIALPVVSA